MKRFALFLLGIGATAFGYIHSFPDVAPLHRPDYGNIQFYVNQNIAAGYCRRDHQSSGLNPIIDYGVFGAV